LPGAGAAAEPAASAPTAKAGASQPSTVALPAVVTRKPATPPPPPRAGTAALAAPDASRSRVAPPSAAPVTVPAAAAAPQPLQSAVLAATPAPGAGMAPSPPAVDATAAQRRQTAARATLAQAQALWNAGSREAALELVREALSLTERDRPVDTTVLATLAREQARMELAQGRPAVVLELLARLEPGLSEQADLWALRGNAAQRLGRHPEAVQAYQRALQLRGGEQRWLLGAAVSLAAQGQLEAAAQHTAQARALGPVSAEVMDYLRQAGVPLH
jgi:tetratricopeptide (TPR) repeat protein